MQGILVTRHCQVEVISVLKENPKEEEQANSWAGYLLLFSAEVQIDTKIPWIFMFNL